MSEIKSILLVDDDELTIKTLTAALQKANYSVYSLKDGFGAIEKCKQELFDMLIVDVNLPGGLKGFDLVTTIRKDERYKEVPIVFITGRNSKADVVKGIKAGADDYIVKPIDFDIFLAKVESLFAKKKGAEKFLFNDSLVRYPAFWNVEFNIIGVSEQGLTFISPVPLVVNTKTQIESTLFSELGIDKPVLRVTNIKEHKTDAKVDYIISTNFIGMNESELKLIRVWVMKNNVRAY